MQRAGRLRVLACAAAVTLACGFAGKVAPAAALAGAPKPPPASTTSTVPPEPKAYVLIDADTGAVVAAKNDRTKLPPASLTKVITAVAAAPLLDPAGQITISARAAGQPSNKVGALAGRAWPTDVAMNVMLLESANDLAMAVAENAGGSAEDFQIVMDKAAQRLGMADGPVLNDPAGLDDKQSVDGGNLVSARDLAIATRALLADEWLSPMVGTQRFGFTDPEGVTHDAVNHNKLVLAGGYPGAIGVKTGFTRKAGRSLIGAARRDGRTMIAVVLNVYDTYGWVRTLLDQGFASQASSQAALPRVPPVVRLTASDVAPPRPVPKPPAVNAPADPATPTPAALPTANVAATTAEGAGQNIMILLGLGGGAIVLFTAGIARVRRQPNDDYRIDRRPRMRV